MQHSDSDIQLFLERSSAYMNINALGPDWENHFVSSTRKLKFQEMKDSFQRGFAKCVLGGVTARDYEIVTGWDFDTEEEFAAHLRYFWQLFYADAAPEDWVEPEWLSARVQR